MSDTQKTGSFEELWGRLSPRHQNFVNAYFECEMNSVQAAEEVGYKSPKEGPRLMLRSDIRATIQARLDQDVMSGSEVLARLSIQARGTMADFLRVYPQERHFWEEATPGLDQSRDDLVWDLSEKYGPQNVARNELGQVFFRKTEQGVRIDFDWGRAQELKRLGLIKKLKREKDGSITFELHDPTRALELLGRAHKLFTDKVELEDNSGPREIVIKREIITRAQEE